MYVLSHGCLLSSDKAFFYLHTWFYLSCVLTSNGCKCLFVVYASCYESFLLSHDVSIFCMMELRNSLQYRYCILDIILLELVFPFFLVTSSWLEGSASMMSLHSSYYSLSLNCRHLFFGTSLHSSLLVGDYVCDLSYKSNAFIWLETFHKEYLYCQVLMHKYMIMQLL